MFWLSDKTAREFSAARRKCSPETPVSEDNYNTHAVYPLGFPGVKRERQTEELCSEQSHLLCTVVIVAV